MISRISGKVVEKGANYVTLDVGSFCYEVLIPPTVMQRLDEFISPDGRLSLITFHYHQVEPSKSIPVLIGFLNDIEKIFFEVFITVSGIGPRAAVKALNKPISEIARAIDEGDLHFLRGLPGIGEQRAKEIVAKLQDKVGKFGLIQDSRGKAQESKGSDFCEEALSVLMQLEYKRAEAQGMVKKAMEINPGLKTTEELLNAVYRQRKAR